MKALKSLKAQLFEQSAVRAEYEAQVAEFEMARALIAARIRTALRTLNVPLTK